MSEPTASQPTENYYDVLGVSESATPAEIKRAYFSAVRRYRPDAFPDIFQKLTDAMGVLGSARTRGEYDQKRKAGRRVQGLVDQAAGILDKDPHKALAILKGTVALAPDLPRPRFLIAQTLLRLEDWAGAEKQYRWLLRSTGSSEALRVKLARCLLKQERYDEAHEQINAVLAVTPVWHDALMWQCRIYEAQENFSAAAQSLETAIQADGKENLLDLDALVRLWEVQHSALAGNEAIARTAARIVGVVPLPGENADVETNAQVARAIMRLCERASELSDSGKDALATNLLHVAARIEGTDESAHSRMADLQKRTVVLSEARQAQTDVLVDGPLRDCIFLKYLDRKGSDAGRQTRLENVLAELQSQINNDPKALSATMDYLKKQYPRLAEAENALLSVLASRAARRVDVLNQSANAPAGGVMPGAPPAAESPVAPPPSPEPAPRSGGLFGWLNRAPANR